jgi:hypothetical protein
MFEGQRMWEVTAERTENKLSALYGNQDLAKKERERRSVYTASVWSIKWRCIF